MRIFSFLLIVLWPFHIAYADDDAIQKAMELADKQDWSHAEQLAEKTANPELIALIEWQTMLDQNSGATFDEIVNFVDLHPNWPFLSILQQRAERSLPDHPTDPDKLIRRYQDSDPITGIGKIVLADVLSSNDGDSERIEGLVKKGWVHGDFYGAEEKRIRSQYGKILTQQDDIERTSRLLWDRQTSAAERMLSLLPSDQQALAKARIALIQDSRKAPGLLSQVSKKLTDDPGLIFDRMRYKAKHNDDEGVRQMLRMAPDDVPYPEKWWPYRESAARQEIIKGNYEEAQKLLVGYDRLEGSDLADALWLDGWLELEFSKNAQKALELFSRMYESVSYPVSLARGAYWAGRASEEMHNGSEADTWYGKAAEHPTTFYGQLAALKLDGGTVLSLPDNFSSDSSPQTLLERAILLCIQTGEYNLASQLLTHAIAEAGDDDEISRLTHMGFHEGVPHLSVRSSKKALQRQLICTRAGYPVPPETGDVPLERALMYAIIRQESEFDRNARSPSGALGMMQLLPSTAQHTARKINTPYHRKNLDIADYNIMLGSNYLSLLINNYGGSYVLGIAAYNAGPGNVSKWIKQFGRPGDTAESTINWIETIPFSETRNYVQRVLENLQVYRRLENDNSIELRQDLVR